MCVTLLSSAFLSHFCWKDGEDGPKSVTEFATGLVVIVKSFCLGVRSTVKLSELKLYLYTTLYRFFILK